LKLTSGFGILNIYYKFIKELSFITEITEKTKGKENNMAAAVQVVDEIIKEYLLFRGFANTLKAFEAELKLDKDKSFRVSTESIQECIHCYISPAALWKYSDICL
jgi:hypothetical protein